MDDLKVKYWNDGILEVWVGFGLSLILKVIKSDLFIF